MHELDALNHLIREHNHGLERKLASAEVEEVFEVWSQQVDDHDVALGFAPAPMERGNAD